MFCKKLSASFNGLLKPFIICFVLFISIDNLSAQTIPAKSSLYEHSSFNTDKT
jgi:hypothetical protein